MSEHASDHDIDAAAAAANEPGAAPWTADTDPWAQTGARRSSAAQPQAESLPPPSIRTTMAGAQHSAGEAPPMRIIHDIPPSWDGAHPEKELEPYMKLLRGWLMTTRTLKSQAGMTILNFANGDLKLIINELDLEDLCSDDSGTVVLKHIVQSYSEFIDKKLPQAIEAGIYDKDIARHRGEHMLQYCMRRDKLCKKLDKEGWSIPP